MNPDYNFVRFVSKGSKLGGYKLSINKSRSIGLLSGFYVKEDIKKFSKAVLFFDKAKKVIGISFTNDSNAEGAFTISHNKNSNNTGSIAAHSFFSGHEIAKPEYCGQRTPRKIKDSKVGTIFVIDLLNK